MTQRNDGRCLGCMAEIGEVLTCPHCGYRVGTPVESPLYLEPGAVLHGQYLIGTVLGHGGFGITYLGWDLNLHLRLAIKEYLPRDAATRDRTSTAVKAYGGESTEFFAYGLDKFIEEARHLAKFDHPNVVRVLNFFRANSTGYLVMEFVEGMTLLEYLNRQPERRLAVDTAVGILMPMMDALREVHKVGLLHRDVSPDNIYISKTGQIKLIDFGAAKTALGNHSRSLALVLKPGFAPTEQYIKSGNQGPWTDVYGLAATLYTSICGEAPPEALERLQQLEQDPLLPPSERGIAIEPAFERALLRALAINAGARFQTIEAFQGAFLARTQSGSVPPPEPVALPLTTAPPTTPKPKPKRGPMLAASLLLLAIAFGGGVWWIDNSQKAIAHEARLRVQQEAKERAQLAAAREAVLEAERKTEERARQAAAREEAALRAEREAEERARQAAAREKAVQAQREAEERARQAAAQEAEIKAQRETEERVREAAAREQAQRKAEAKRQAETLARVDELPKHFIQLALKEIGVYNGTIDGLLGSGSQRAVRAWQKAKGYEQTGKLDNRQTVEMFQQAAADGHPESQNILGMMRAAGVGLPKDLQAANRWFEKSANQGNAYAAYNLGVHYREGRGVEKSIPKAKEYFRKAKDSGHPQANEALVALR